MSIETSAEIKTFIKDYLERYISTINTSDNIVLTDIFIDSISEELADAYTEVLHIQKEQGVVYPNDISEDELDRIAYNWNLTRRGASYAQGFVTFSSFTQPSATIRIGDVDGSGGIVVQTSRQDDGSVVSFTTTETDYILTTTTANPSTGLYSVTIPITCNEAGTAGNVGANTIVNFSGVSGVDRITNSLALTGGKEKETNVELGIRIAAKVVGLHKGIEGGTQSLAFLTSGVVDAKIFGPNDTGFTRFPDGGGADLYILGSNLSSYTQTSTYTTGDSTISLTKKPVSSIISVTGTVGLTNATLTQGIDYSFTQDTTSSTAYSTTSDDKVTWLSGNKPNTSTSVEVIYTYDKLINDLQDLINEEGNHFVGANILVRKGTEVIVDMTFSITKDSGVDSTTLESAVVTAISEEINTYVLGVSVEMSDIINVIKNVSGVDNVTSPFTNFNKRGLSGYVNTIPITKKEYARVDENSITITIS